MFKILIGLDGSPAADAALDLACDLLAGQQAQVTLLHVIPPEQYYRSTTHVADTWYDPHEVATLSAMRLGEIEQRVQRRHAGLTTKTAIEVGDPADLILAVAERDDADVIVLGSRDLTATQRVLRGSVSNKVSTRAPCAVLIVPPRAAVTAADKQAAATAV